MTTTRAMMVPCRKRWLMQAWSGTMDDDYGPREKEENAEAGRPRESTALATWALLEVAVLRARLGQRERESWGRDVRDNGRNGSWQGGPWGMGKTQVHCAPHPHLAGHFGRSLLMGDTACPAELASCMAAAREQGLALPLR